jgi:hypothetical protein
MMKDLDGTGFTVIVLVPGGVTQHTDDLGRIWFPPRQVDQLEIMALPAVWLVSDAAGQVAGRRFLAVHWDATMSPEEAAGNAGAPVAWTSIATMPITRSRSYPPSKP